MPSIYSQNSRHAVHLLGVLIKVERKKRGMTAQEVADRAGVSRGLVQRIEAGHVSCGIGSVFEVAAIVGVPLFVEDQQQLRHHIQKTAETLALLPERIRSSESEVDDEF